MTVRAYCDAAYALVHREYQRLGSHLEEARDKLEGWDVAGSGAATVGAASVVDDDAVAMQNEQELRKLQALMGGLG